MLAFTDSSSNGRTAYAINDKGYVVQTAPGSAQIVELQELQAVAMAFKLFFIAYLINLLVVIYF